MRPCNETRYGWRGLRGGGRTIRTMRAAVPHCDRMDGPESGPLEFVKGTAAMTG